jgi:hypothetical protein
MKERFISTCVALEETRLCAEKLLHQLDPDASSSPTLIQSAFLAEGGSARAVVCLLLCVGGSRPPPRIVRTHVAVWACVRGLGLGLGLV